MDYTGYKVLRLDDDMLSQLYTYGNLGAGAPEFLVNEYLIATDKDDNPVDYFRYNTEGYFVRVPFRTIQTDYIGEVTPRNAEQRIAIDMLKNPDIGIKMLGGSFGRGKDFLMLAQAYAMLQSGEIDKIVYVRNNIGVEGSKDIGYIPGDILSKSLPWAMPLADILGSKEALLSAIEREEIEIEPLYYLRGRSFKKSIIYVSEGENLTKKNIQLLIGRVGEGSQLFINGDCKQADTEAFRKDSGMELMLERLAGQPLFGYVKLEKNERSAIASLCDLLD